MPLHNVTLKHATNAVYGIFIVVGVVFANWASRLPAVRDALEYSPAQMGRLLLIGAIGSVIALPTSGWIAQRLGAKRAIQLSAAFLAGGYLIAGLTVGTTPIVYVGLGLFLGGIGMGVCDTSMNLEGARVERELKKSILPRFHGGFSLGTMGGALTGAAAAAVDLSVSIHIAIVVVLGFIAIQVCSLYLLPDTYTQEPMHDPSPVAVGVVPTTAEPPSYEAEEAIATASSVAPTETEASAREPQLPVWKAWLSGRTWLIGIIVLSAALTEGAANDWLALGVVDGFHVSDEMGAFALFVFLTAMTVGRFAGTNLLDAYGRLAVLRGCAVFALVGLALFGLSPWMWLSIVGGALWGLGACLGFPVGMSAASDHPHEAAARLSAVATIGYTAFFAGPPLLGELASHVGYRQAMLAIMVPAVVGLLVSGAAKERGASADALAVRRNKVGTK